MKRTKESFLEEILETSSISYQAYDEPHFNYIHSTAQPYHPSYESSGFEIVNPSTWSSNPESFHYPSVQHETASHHDIHHRHSRPFHPQKLRCEYVDNKTEGDNKKDY